MWYKSIKSCLSFFHHYNRLIMVCRCPCRNHRLYSQSQHVLVGHSWAPNQGQNLAGGVPQLPQHINSQLSHNIDWQRDCFAQCGFLSATLVSNINRKYLPYNLFILYMFKCTDSLILSSLWSRFILLISTLYCMTIKIVSKCMIQILWGFLVKLNTTQHHPL